MNQPGPRRVLYLAWAPFFSGAERALLLTLRSMNGSGYEPYVIAGTDGDFAAAVRDLGIPCEIVPLTQFERRRAHRAALSVAKVVSAARRCRASLIHSNDMPSYQPGGFAARILRIPAVTHLRFPDSSTGYRWFLRPRFAMAIFISEAFKTAALDEAPDVFGDRTTVLYDAVESQPLWSPEERASRRQELGLPNDRPVIAIAGQVAEVKGIWEFVEAAQLLRDTRATFAVLGDDLRTKGAVRAEMEARVAALGLSDRFRFLGYRSDAPQTVQAFDIVAVPSHVEPFGLSSLEAMATGRPVVATRVGGIPEVVVDGRTGLLVPPKDAPALAQGLRRLLENQALRDEMGIEGRRRAGSVFGLNTHGAGLGRLYDRIAS